MISINHLSSDILKEKVEVYRSELCVFFKQDWKREDIRKPDDFYFAVLESLQKVVDLKNDSNEDLITLIDELGIELSFVPEEDIPWQVLMSKRKVNEGTIRRYFS